MNNISGSDILYIVFLIYWFLAIFFTFKILIRAKIMDSMLDFFFNFSDVYKRVIALKWKKSEMPMIPSDDLMLNFVIFAQRTKYIALILLAILIN